MQKSKLQFKIKNYKFLLSCCLTVLLFFIVMDFAQAQIIEKVDCSQVTQCPSNDESLNKYCCGNYELNDFVKIAIRVAAWILSITGSLALLFFIYGGVMFLISAGSQERVNKAKSIITGAVIGVIIVLSSFLIINFTLTSLGADTFGGKPWYKITK